MTDVKAIFISDVIAADDNGYSASAQVANNAALTLGGALASGGAVTNSSGRLTEITSGGDDSGISFTVVGTDVNGDSMSESITGADTGAATGTVASATVVHDVSVPQDGVLFENGAYAKFAVGKCESITVFRS